jgi:hypothetical protein
MECFINPISLLTFFAFSGTRVHPLLLVWRMAWGEINGLLLVSGGLGMFDKETVIEAGGYS